MMNVVSAFEYRAVGSSRAETVFGELSPSKVFMTKDAEFEKDHLICLFPSMPPSEPSEPFYYFLTEPGDNDYMIAAYWNGKKYKLETGKNPQGEFTLSGLDEELRPIQPNVFKISEHCYRMYFWAHYHGEARKVRMLIAESSDNRHWKIINDARPAFCHYSDVMCREKRFPVSRQCNDATALYMRKDGKFEVFSAALVHLDANNNTRYYQKDIWRGYVRVIQRWVGDGFEDWSHPEIVMIPDAEDPIDLQMYYLLPNELSNGSFGWLGRYSAVRQSMTMEPVWSFDRRHWERPLRGAYGPETEEKYPITAPAHHMVECGDKFKLYYSRSSSDHNFKTAGGAKPYHELCWTELDKHRLFGKLVTPGTGLLSPSLRMVDPSLSVYSSDDAELEFVWLNAFGEKSGKNMAVVRSRPDKWDIVLKDCAPGCTGMLEIRGKGKVFDLVY